MEEAKPYESIEEILNSIETEEQAEWTRMSGDFFKTITAVCYPMFEETKGIIESYINTVRFDSIPTDLYDPGEYDPESKRIMTWDNWKEIALYRLEQGFDKNYFCDRQRRVIKDFINIK